MSQVSYLRMICVAGFHAQQKLKIKKEKADDLLGLENNTLLRQGQIDSRMFSYQ